jgi:hypothetical protein
MNGKVDLTHHSFPKPVQDIVNLYKNGQLNLSPGFQRDSVWTERDRSKLIDSIIRNYPLPAIFLHCREHNGQIVYDVIDGKQRIETILMFMGLLRGKKFRAKVQMSDAEELIWTTWDSLRRHQQQPMITGYKLLTIEVDGDLHDIIDVFVRINSTGKALTRAEKDHAKYYSSEFLKTAARVASKYEDYFIKNQIISPGQISRMKHIELICELMISIDKGEVINKKAALDKVMAPKTTMSSAQIKKARDKTITAINRLQKMFPRLSQTRFCQLSDFYVLAVLIAKYEAEKMILMDKKRNKLAWDLLVEFSNGVDRVRMKQKKAEGISEGEDMYRDYLLTVLHTTDEISQRRKREQILDGLLCSLFEKKDSQRSFSLEQRRLIWNTSEEKKCKTCKKSLTWKDFTIDHIAPHSKGGRTALDNAALMCRIHNSSKGNRSR